MRRTRRLIAFLGSAIGIWVLGSFAGAMLNPANAGFWSSSLMWSLLAGLLVAPGLLMVHHASVSRSRGTGFSATEAPGPKERGTERPSPSPEQKPFAEEKSMNTLWPQPSTPAKEQAIDEQAAEEEWPQNRTEKVA